VTYRSVLANREFAALVLGQTFSTFGDQLARIAVAVMVFSRTSSPLAASATYAISYASYLVGGPVLSSLSDRWPRLTVMVACDLLRAPLVLLLCVRSLPLAVVFVVVGLIGVLGPPFDSARGAVQPDLLPGEAYVTGNALINVLVQSAQVVGFAVGGALVAEVSVRGALALDAATFVISAGLLLAFLAPRPAALHPDQSRGLLADTVEGWRLVVSDRYLRSLLLMALLGSALLIAPEGLAVPIAADLGRGPITAGFLTASIPAGFVLGGIVILRLEQRARIQLLPWLVLGGGVPLILTAFSHSAWVIGALWLVAGAAGAVNLVASSAFMQACPREFRARAYGLAGTLLYAVQGLVLLLSGATAGTSGARESVALFAGLVLALLVLAISRGQRPIQVFSTTGRRPSG